jgi:hypothetical protein
MKKSLVKYRKRKKWLTELLTRDRVARGYKTKTQKKRERKGLT